MSVWEGLRVSEGVRGSYRGLGDQGSYRKRLGFLEGVREFRRGVGV